MGYFNWDGLRRYGRLELGLLLTILCAVAGLWTFLALAEEVVEGSTVRFDQHLLRAFRRPDDPAVPIGPAWTLQVARDLTAFGGVAGLTLITGSVAGYLALQGRKELLALMLTSVLGGTVFSLALKHLFHRPRPEVVPHLTDIASSSFPSGHSLLSSVVYLTLATLLARATRDLKTKVYLFALAVLLVFLIGTSRVYLGVHYPTDVLAGWGFGSAWAIVCCQGVNYFVRKRDTVPENADAA